MATLAQLRARVYFLLGTSTNDRAYPSARVNELIQDAINQLTSDLPGDYFVSSATLAADGGAGRVYTLATQASPITNWRQFREVRITDFRGSLLTPGDFSQLEAWADPMYCVTGPDHNPVLRTSQLVADGAALYVVYTTWPDAVDDDAEAPDHLPRQFHDLVALIASQMAFSSGGEGSFPDEQAERLAERHAQFLNHVGNRGGQARRQRLAAVGR